MRVSSSYSSYKVMTLTEEDKIIFDGWLRAVEKQPPSKAGGCQDLPINKYMTEKQKTGREVERLKIFNDLKSLFKINGIYLLFTKELEVKKA